MSEPKPHLRLVNPEALSPELQARTDQSIELFNRIGDDFDYFFETIKLPPEAIRGGIPLKLILPHLSAGSSRKERRQRIEEMAEALPEEIRVVSSEAEHDEFGPGVKYALVHRHPSKVEGLGPDFYIERRFEPYSQPSILEERAQTYDVHDYSWKYVAGSLGVAPAVAEIVWDAQSIELIYDKLAGLRLRAADDLTELIKNAKNHELNGLEVAARAKERYR